MNRQPYKISFSGGRTSAYMTKLLLDNWGHLYDFIVTFANTGLEHEKTLEFVHNCDKHFGFGTVWLEADVLDRGLSTGHKVVSFGAASRCGEPFEAVIKKYGIPNRAYPHCTRELKLNPMNSYLRSLGLDPKRIPTAIGIREDEQRRVSKAAGSLGIEYPLIDVWPTDKGDVLDWWAQQPFDLGLEEFEGNCRGCYKKSYKKLFQTLDANPDALDWHRRMETDYGDVGPSKTSRVFFRGNLSTDALLRLKQETEGAGHRIPALYENGGCTESCEVYGTE
jgi:hypothetical protein